MIQVNVAISDTAIQIVGTDLVGPRGATGSQGAIGPTGAASTVPGPTGATGPSDTATKLTVDGQLLTRAGGVPAAITRTDLAADPAFTSRYAPAPVSDLTIILGDSIAIGSDQAAPGFIPYQGGSWFGYLCKASGGRIQYLRNAGVSGQNTTQMLARIQTDVIAYQPGWCILGPSPNDSSQGLSLATAKANIVAIIDALRAAGIRPIATLAPPNNTGAINIFVTTMNAWMALYALAHGIPILDLHTPLTNPATGIYTVAYSDDGLHPNAAGRKAVGDYLATRIPAAFGTGPMLTTGLGDTGNLIVNGCFVGDSNVDGIANNWTLGGGTFTSKSLVAMTAAEGVGNWQQLVCDASSAYLYSDTVSVGATLAIGDVVEFTGKFQSDTAVSVSIYLKTTTGVSLCGPVALWTQNAVGTFVFQGRGVVPAGATGVRVQLWVNTTAGAARFGQITVRNLTNLGVV